MSSTEIRRTVFTRINGRVHRVHRPTPTKLHRRRRALLLELPLELREQIYSYIGARNEQIKLRDIKRPMALALVNRQLFREVTRAYFQSNDWSLSVFLVSPEGGMGEDSERPGRQVTRCFHTTGQSLGMSCMLPVLRFSTSSGRKESRTDKLSLKQKATYFIYEEFATGSRSWLSVSYASIRLRRLTLTVDFGNIGDALALINLSCHSAPHRDQDGRHKLKVEMKVTPPGCDRRYMVRDCAREMRFKEVDRLDKISKRLRDAVDKMALREDFGGFTLCDVETMTRTIDLASSKYDLERHATKLKNLAPPPLTTLSPAPPKLPPRPVRMSPDPAAS